MKARYKVKSCEKAVLLHLTMRRWGWHWRTRNFKRCASTLEISKDYKLFAILIWKQVWTRYIPLFLSCRLYSWMILPKETSTPTKLLILTMRVSHISSSWWMFTVSCGYHSLHWISASSPLPRSSLSHSGHTISCPEFDSNDCQTYLRIASDLGLDKLIHYTRNWVSFF